MEAYRKKLKAKIGLLSTLTILVIVLIAWSIVRYRNMPTDKPAEDFFSGFQTGLFSGFMIVMFWRIWGYIRAVRNEEKLRALYIKAHDERSWAIYTQARSNAFWISFLCLAATAVVSGFYSYTVFYTLLGVVLFMGGVAISTKIFFSRKL